MKRILCITTLVAAAHLGACAAGNDADGLDAASERGGAVAIPAGGRIERDVAYGSDPAQRADVYLPKQGAAAAPVILMVHGGAWMFGDKGASGVVVNKVGHWVPKGYVLVSVNYRMARPPSPLEQADDVARALAFVQARAAAWGGDPMRVLLMGHSSGAHLVALLAADPTMATRQGAKPWLGTVSLDSAALNVVDVMEGRHLPFYDRVFGRDRARWAEVSPLQRLSAAPRPMLLVCSSQRSDSCPAARAFAAKATALGGRATVLPQDLKHGEINKELGRPGDYTAEVERFMSSLGLP